MLGILLAIWVGLNSQPSEPCREGAEAYQNQDYARAETLLKQCLSQHSDEITPYLNLCAFFQSQGRLDDLYAIAGEGLQRFPAEKRFYLTVGAGAGRRGDYDRAIEALAGGLKKWPDDTRLHQILVEAYLARGIKFLDSGDNKLAETDLREALKLDPGNKDAMVNLGRVLHNLQLSGQALALFDRVKRRAPETPLIDFNRGVALSGLGRFDEVIPAMTRQLLLTPDYAACYYLRGLAFLRRGEWDKARADLTTAVEAMPDFHEGIYRLGRCYLHFGQLKEAEAAFRKSAELEPSDIRSFYALGRVLQEAGRVEEAKEMFQKAENQYIRDELESEGIQFGSTRGDLTKPNRKD